MQTHVFSVSQMESELERFQQQNLLLELNIDELQQKLKASESETLRERQKVRFLNSKVCMVDHFLVIAFCGLRMMHIMQFNFLT